MSRHVEEGSAKVDAGCFQPSFSVTHFGSKGPEAGVCGGGDSELTHHALTLSKARTFPK